MVGGTITATHDWNALRDGVGRVNRAPAVLAAIWLFAVLLTWPIAMSSRIDTRWGSTYQACRSTSRDDAVRAPATDSRAQCGVRGRHRSDDAEPVPFIDYESRWLVALTASYPFLAFLMLASGGIIDRYARDRRPGLTACAGRPVCSSSDSFAWAFSWRWLRAGIPPLGRWPGACRRPGTVNLVFDYAQIRAVVEDRRSMFGALAIVGIVPGRNCVAALVLYVLDWLILAAVRRIRVARTRHRISLRARRPYRVDDRALDLINQVFVIARLWVRLVFWASATTLFQRQLAAPGYVARPLPEWPDSPSARRLKLGSAEVG